MKDKIFLTGARRVGKSTAVERILCQLHCKVGGFRTGFKDDDRCALYMTDLSSGESSLLMQRDELGNHQVFAESFDGFGVRAMEADAPLMVMDELGFLEKDAAAFRARVLALLDDEVPVLGVLRQGNVPWLEAVRIHPRTQVIVVSPENRDSIPAEVLGMLAKLGLW